MILTDFLEGVGVLTSVFESTFVFVLTRDTLFWLWVPLWTFRIGRFSGSGDEFCPRGFVGASRTIVLVALSARLIVVLPMELIKFVTVPTTSGMFSVFRPASSVVSVFRWARLSGFVVPGRVGLCLLSPFFGFIQEFLFRHFPFEIVKNYVVEVRKRG